MSTILDRPSAQAPAFPADTPAAVPSAPSAASAPARWPGVRPQLSVVIPTCGRPGLLLRCLNALLQQDLDPQRFEVVVVDDGRCERTRTLVDVLSTANAQPQLRYLRPASGRGPAHARNLGWQSSFGEIVAFTDDDTMPMADWLSRGLAALTNAAPLAAVAGRVEVPLSPDEPPTDHQRMTQGLERTQFVTANAFVRRGALLQVQGFDERFTRAWREDSDLQFRLEADAGPVGRVEDAVVLHPVRAEPWGVSLRQQRNAFFEALLYAKHPQRYRDDVGLDTPWHYYLIVALTLAVPWLLAAGIPGSALVAAAIALLLIGRFAAMRLRGTSRRPEHVAEMLVTSAAIPFLSVYWRLRGAWHFRVWFL